MPALKWCSKFIFELTSVHLALGNVVPLYERRKQLLLLPLRRVHVFFIVDLCRCQQCAASNFYESFASGLNLLHWGDSMPFAFIFLFAYWT